MKRLIEEYEEWINSTWKKIEKKLTLTAELSNNKIPYSTVNGIHDNCITSEAPHNIAWWTNGFWPGIMWLMYYATGNDAFKKTAEYAERALDNALTNASRIDHDLGFMWHLSAGADYRITGNEQAKNRNLLAALLLAGRFNHDGGFIRAWNNTGYEGYAIIDCMMNIPLLYWASDETGDPRFRQIAMKHADKTMNNHVRPDGSVYHILQFDPETGDFIKAPTTQGYDAATSSWSRGQGWALYGFILSYIHTGKQEYLDASKKVAHYFISAIADDGYVPKCDFRAPDEPFYIDTTAGAVAACGLIEIAKAVPQYEKKLYLKAAINILTALDKNHCDWTEEEHSILQNGTEAYGRGIHMPIIYGDFYFIEAVYKLKGFDFLIW
ncbi:MAG: glycoside hydrolase family 88 protein [Clostridia bacterium]|nr:glycoside hydrolase family 88 protein [Clostridia bacterium]